MIWGWPRQPGPCWAVLGRFLPLWEGRDSGLKDPGRLREPHLWACQIWQMKTQDTQLKLNFKQTWIVFQFASGPLCIGAKQGAQETIPGFVGLSREVGTGVGRGQATGLRVQSSLRACVPARACPLHPQVTSTQSGHLERSQPAQVNKSPSIGAGELWGTGPRLCAFLGSRAQPSKEHLQRASRAEVSWALSPDSPQPPLMPSRETGGQQDVRESLAYPQQGPRASLEGGPRPQKVETPPGRRGAVSREGSSEANLWWWRQRSLPLGPQVQFWDPQGSMVSSPDSLRAQGEGPALLRITSRQAGRREKLTNTPKGLVLRKQKKNCWRKKKRTAGWTHLGGRVTRSNLRSVASLSSSLLERGLWRGERWEMRSVKAFGSDVGFLKQKLDPQEEKKKKFSVPLCQMSTLTQWVRRDSLEFWKNFFF